MTPGNFMFPAAVAFLILANVFVDRIPGVSTAAKGIVWLITALLALSALLYVAQTLG